MRLAADADEQEKFATQHDIQRLITIIKQRDARIIEAERDINSLLNALEKLKRDLVPVFRMAKNKNQDLPPAPNSAELGRDRDGRERRGHDEAEEQVHDPPPLTGSTLQPAPSTGRSLSRKFSMKKLILGNPKNASPTHASHPDYSEPMPPNSAALGSGPQLPPQLPPITGGSILSAHDIQKFDSHPSPTSPATMYRPSTTPSLENSTLVPNSHRPPDRGDPSPRTPRELEHEREHKRDRPRDRDRDRDRDDGSSVEIFKSFRVSMDDPCYKVLPAALKRYNIQADWRQYALYIVHGDQERCLGLEERPLILFKQLDREGRKPMFMLRRNGNPANVDIGGFQVPGGVL